MFDDLAWRFAIIYSFIFDFVTLGLISIFAQLKLKKNNKNYEGVLFERMLCSINKNKYDITKKNSVFHVSMCLCGSRSHVTSKCVKKEKVAKFHRAWRSNLCHSVWNFLFITTKYRVLIPIDKQTTENIEKNTTSTTKCTGGERVGAEWGFLPLKRWGILSFHKLLDNQVVSVWRNNVKFSVCYYSKEKRNARIITKILMIVFLSRLVKVPNILCNPLFMYICY